ncbi:hypothetical protein, partial [Verminephrobacter aporrectodeae]|uniref:hypothetical protein n=1 Tax=Verminephrobacter aporrectodeae TaxID=1110389 RepID=UPI00223801DE
VGNGRSGRAARRAAEPGAPPERRAAGAAHSIEHIGNGRGGRAAGTARSCGAAHGIEHVGHGLGGRAARGAAVWIYATTSLSGSFQFERYISADSAQVIKLMNREHYSFFVFICLIFVAKHDYILCYRETFHANAHSLNAH